ncbi:hypothetical protein [Nocardioides terrigena]|uniref:hypothetical protein n=1 Tax=Nocardioides terrigena TaxID=424797 RepID=UPI000D323B72|nr:hypothetical protein [Nocardioides terrigena]
MFVVPTEFRAGPFTRAEALAAGVTPRVLEGVQFVRLHHGVYQHRAHVPCFADELRAARLALPEGARTTGITRLQELGLDHGPRAPLHFVVEGDHHLALAGVFLHRTVAMPPEDGTGASAEAAFVAYCAEARVIDAIKVGSALLHSDLMDVVVLEALAIEQPWRRGCAEAQWLIEHLDGRCRSLPEAELLALVRFSGMPQPEVNEPLELADGLVITPDLWFPAWRRVVEYEGSQHQEDRDQYTGDIDRYAAYRRGGVGYEQVTKELMRNPRTTVRRVHRSLVEGGYDGPAPEFGDLWVMLFRRLSDVVRPLNPSRRR